MPLNNSNILQRTFGYPPDNLEERTNIMIRKSMPVVTFFPSKPHFQSGLDLFSLTPAWGEYTKLLKGNGFETPNLGNDGIKLAYLADNFPTDSFTNEYGENFLQKFTDVASEGAASIAQMMGASSATDVFRKVQKNLQGKDTGISKGLGTGMEYIGNMAKSSLDALSQIPIGKTAAAGVNVVNRLLAGSRIDFPMVWKSSGFQPSYSFTVRLYNPYPQDEDYTNKYIIGPVVAILLMGVPRAQDSATFTWPFLHRIECPGLFDLDPGFISNITVVKGGDQQQISLNQRLGIVDVRIDVGSLYSSMLGGSDKVTSIRPTVLKYARSMAGQKNITSRRDDNLQFSRKPGDGPQGNRAVGATSRGEDIRMSGQQYTISTPSGTQTLTYRTRPTVSPKVQADATDTGAGGDNTPTDRVDSDSEDVYQELVDKGLPF